MQNRLKSRKFWLILTFGILTAILILAGAIPNETWKWFLGTAGAWFLGQSYVDGQEVKK